MICEMLRRRAERAAKELPRSGLKQADLRMEVAGLEQAAEIIEWLTLHEKAITKAAKQDVPWRAST